MPSMPPAAAGSPARRSQTRLTVCLFAMLTAAPAFAQGARPPSAPGAARQQQDPLLASARQWDTNGDGTYTCDEWKLHMMRLFSDADRDRNGMLNPQEFKALGALDPTFSEADFAFFDGNKDGRISRAEFVAVPSPFFVRYDANHDCKVTPAEVPTAAPARKPQDKGGAGPGGPGIGGSGAGSPGAGGASPF